MSARGRQAFLVRYRSGSPKTEAIPAQSVPPSLDLSLELLGTCLQWVGARHAQMLRILRVAPLPRYARLCTQNPDSSSTGQAKAAPKTGIKPLIRKKKNKRCSKIGNYDDLEHHNWYDNRYGE